MYLYLSSVNFVLAGALSSLNFGYPWNIALQFMGMISILIHYWNTEDRLAQIIGCVPIMCFNIMGVVTLWIN